MRTRVVIQSRLSSSRLPAKALLPLGGMPLIELVARRASRGGHEVVVATSDEASDDLIARHCERAGIAVVRGPLDDVLGRFALAAQGLDDADRVVRITGDNPLVDAALIDELASAMEASGNVYARVEVEHVPYGLGAEAFSAGDLRRAASEATSPFDREHVTPWLRRTLGELSYVPPASPGGSAAYRCTVDCLDDYERMAALFEGVDDSVGTPWPDLAARLGTGDASVGLIERDGAPLSAYALGVQNLVDAPAADIRSTFARAARRGVTHVLARPEGASAIAAGTLPALRDRFGIIVMLPAIDTPIDGPGHLAWQVRAGVEHALAVTQAGTLAGVLFASAEDAFAGDGGAWDALGEYVARGRVAERGVVLTDPEQAGMLERLDGLSLVVVDASDPRYLAPQTADRLSALGEGVTILSVAPSPDAARAALAVAWVDAVIAQPRSADDLDAILGAGEGR